MKITNNKDGSFSYIETVIKQIVAKDDEATREVIRDYVKTKYPKENVRIDFLDKEVIDEVINLGIKEYLKIHSKENR